ncbi:MAG: hypothetical protein ACR2P9_00100 [Gammaproteobacteria bacterium]
MNDLLSQYPEVTAIVVALGGLVIARILALASGAGLAWLEYLLLRLAPNWVGNIDIEGFQPVVRGLTFYLVLFFFLLLALRILDVTVAEGWLDWLIAHLPGMVIAAVIVLTGYLLGLVARAAIAGVLPHTSSQLLPYTVQFLIVGTAILTAMAQLTIDVTFLTVLIITLLATFLGGLAMAFALGSRQLVANVLARREMERYQVGVRIRIGEVEGNIINVLDTAVVLEHPGGTTTIPASRFASEVVTVIDQDPTEVRTDVD